MEAITVVRAGAARARFWLFAATIRSKARIRSASVARSGSRSRWPWWSAAGAR